MHQICQNMDRPRIPKDEPWRLAVIGGVAGLFLACLLLAKWWFAFDGPSDEASHRLSLQTQPEGYSFASEELTSKALVLLGTQEIVNGSYVPIGAVSTEPNLISKHGPIRVFLASWPADKGSGVNFLDHTPDICWVQIGWKRMELGIPEKVVFSVGETKIPFQLRAFQWTGSGQELVAWCGLVGGKPVETLVPPPVQRGKPLVQRLAARLTQARMVLGHALSMRLSPNSEKQFVRLSTPIQSDWNESLKQLQTFAEQQLVLTSASSRGLATTKDALPGGEDVASALRVQR